MKPVPVDRIQISLMFTIFVGLAQIMLTAPSGAQPAFDTYKHCENVGGVGGTFSRVIYGACLQMEDQASANLRSDWSSIPQSVQQHCIQVASVGGSPSYTILKACIQMELVAPAPRSAPRAPPPTAGPKVITVPQRN